MRPHYTSGVPRVHHHVCWTGFNGLPFRTPLSSEENTFFMSTHKLCLGLFRKAQIIVPLSIVAYFSRIPTSRNCLFKYMVVVFFLKISTDKSTHFSTSHIYLVTHLVQKEKKRIWFLDRSLMFILFLLDGSLLSNLNFKKNIKRDFHRILWLYFL